MSTHPIVHIEISTKDAPASARFYSEVFGWKIEVDPQFNYYQFAGEGGPGGGFVNVDEHTKAGDVIPYLAADDIDAMLKNVERAGGKVVQPKTEIPGIGWFALFADPTGNRIGLYSKRDEI